MLLRWLGCATVLLACGGPPPKSADELARDGVPANSVSEARLRGDDVRLVPDPPPSAGPGPSIPVDDVDMGGHLGAGDDAPEEPAPAAGPRSAPTPATEPATKGKPGKVATKAECAQLFDRFVSLTVASDPRFAGLPPDALAQLKSEGFLTAARQAGDPCATESVSRAQYTCAMAAKTPSAWEKCLK